jgi:spore maturation protein CgeB
VKVLIIGGSDSFFSIENFYVKYMRGNGIEVKHYAAQQDFYNYYRKNIVNKLLFRAGLSTIFKKINEVIIKQANVFQPDIVWIFKGMEIFPQTLQVLKNSGCKLVNYNPDNPFIFTGKGSGNENVIRCISYYDLHFSYNHEIESRLRKEYHAVTATLPFGFDVSQELYNKCMTEPEVLKVCFLGNPDEQRAKFLEQLADKVGIDVYGNNWQRFITHPNITCYQEIKEEEFWKTLRKYRVQLNLMRVHNEDSHNMRTFEVPAIGGVLLAPLTKEHPIFFEHGKEAFFYSGADDCSVFIQKIIAMPREQINNIREAARKVSLEKGYSYEKRAKYVLSVFENMLNNI